jgi:myo-inositol-1(or 4)-monophosphatase
LACVCLSPDPAIVIAAARAGAAIVRKLHGQRLARINKGGGDFATAADLAAEEAVLDVIRAARPDDAVLGEESGRQGASGAAPMAGRSVCGTLNYAVGSMLVAVYLALARPGLTARFRPRVVSTALALAWVAAGKRAAYVTGGATFPPACIFATGIALCRSGSRSPAEILLRL